MLFIVCTPACSHTNVHILYYAHSVDGILKQYTTTPKKRKHNASVDHTRIYTEGEDGLAGHIRCYRQGQLSILKEAIEALKVLL